MNEHLQNRGGNPDINYFTWR